MAASGVLAAGGGTSGPINGGQVMVQALQHPRIDAAPLPRNEIHGDIGMQ